MWRKSVTCVLCIQLLGLRKMKQSSLALLILIFATAFAQGQTVTRAKRWAAVSNDDRFLAAQALSSMEQLESDVIVYRSLGDFEATGKLTRVSFETFQNDLCAASAEVEPILLRLPTGKVRTELANALASYRDGAFWWEKIYQPRVVNVSALSFDNTNTSSDISFLSTVPYTVAIHWRQAAKYLKQVKATMNEAASKTP
jgi:hypothetical protein